MRDISWNAFSLCDKQHPDSNLYSKKKKKRKKEKKLFSRYNLKEMSIVLWVEHNLKFTNIFCIPNLETDYNIYNNNNNNNDKSTRRVYNTFEKATPPSLSLSPPQYQYLLKCFLILAQLSFNFIRKRNNFAQESIVTTYIQPRYDLKQ